ncbi:MAG: TspO/MBR family protein [Sphingomicrobium sp.]
MADEADGKLWGKYGLITVPAIVLAGSASGLLSGSGGANGWYATLHKPLFNPPPIAFPVAWTILYALMGVALAMILVEPPSPRRKTALVLFALQLALNYAWSPIFFGAHDIHLARIVIYVMAMLAALTAGQFLRVKRVAGLLLIPYLAWLIFAAVLNGAIEDLNPGAGTALLG